MLSIASFSEYVNNSQKRVCIYFFRTIIDHYFAHPPPEFLCIFVVFALFCAFFLRLPHNTYYVVFSIYVTFGQNFQRPAQLPARYLYDTNPSVCSMGGKAVGCIMDGTLLIEIIISLQRLSSVVCRKKLRELLSNALSCRTQFLSPRVPASYLMLPLFSMTTPPCLALPFVCVILPAHGRPGHHC